MHTSDGMYMTIAVGITAPFAVSAVLLTASGSLDVHARAVRGTEAYIMF